jgi:reactive intermediate/imine deaminase
MNHGQNHLPRSGVVGRHQEYRRTAGKLVRGDIAVQTELVLENIKRAVESAGSSLDKVVKTNVYITNAAYFRVVNEIYARFFPHEPPARTFVAMASWPMEFDIEIECIATV